MKLQSRLGKYVRLCAGHPVNGDWTQVWDRSDATEFTEQEAAFFCRRNRGAVKYFGIVFSVFVENPVSGPEPCPACGGSGTIYNTKMVAHWSGRVCPLCEGSGCEP